MSIYDMSTVFSDPIDTEYIKEGLHKAGLPVCVVYKEETGSTNEDARLLASGSDIPILVIANKQNKGRGRRGRDFYSPVGTGLYMSIALGNAKELIKTVKMTAIAAVAVAQAIDNAVFSGAETSLIKWVNDIYVDERKVCGILSEAFLSPENGKDGCMVVGIGINVYEPAGGFPGDINMKAGYLIPAGQSVRKGLRNKLVLEVIKQLFYYMGLPEESLAEYRRRSNLTGSYVKVNSFVPGDEDKECVKVLGIDDEYGLIVEHENGQKMTLTSGEVSVVKVKSTTKI